VRITLALSLSLAHSLHCTERQFFFGYNNNVERQKRRSDDDDKCLCVCECDIHAYIFMCMYVRFFMFRTNIAVKERRQTFVAGRLVALTNCDVCARASGPSVGRSFRRSFCCRAFFYLKLCSLHLYVCVCVLQTHIHTHICTRSSLALSHKVPFLYL